MRSMYLIGLLCLLALTVQAQGDIFQQVTSDSKWEDLHDEFQRQTSTMRVKRATPIVSSKIEKIISWVQTFKAAYTLALKKFLKIAKTETAVLGSRIKSVDSILGKMARKPDKYSSVEKLKDILGFRFTAQTVPNVLRIVIALLTDPDIKVVEVECYGICSLQKYRSSGYRRVHLTVMVLGKYAEIQLGTPYTNFWSNWDHELIYKGPLSDNPEAQNYKVQVADYLYQLDELRKRMPACPEALKKLDALEVLQSHLDNETAQMYYSMMGEPANACFTWPDLTVAAGKQAPFPSKQKEKEEEVEVSEKERESAEAKELRRKIKELADELQLEGMLK